MTYADFNADGKTDLAVATQGAGLEVLLGNGDGTFQAPAGYATTVQMFAIATGDFNGDGAVDIAVSGTFNFWTTTIYVYLNKNDGTGTFNAPSSFTTTRNANNMVAADLDSDGHVDLAIGGNGTTVFYGDGTGAFTAAWGTPGFYGQPTRAIDIDGDGRLDIVLSDSNLQWLHSLGSRTWEVMTPPALSKTYFTPWTDAADLNGDGRPDLLFTADSGDSTNRAVVATWLNLGGGTFAAPVSVDVPGVDASTYLAIADFNRDGKPDVALAGQASTFVAVLPGNGDGTFAAPLTYSTPGTGGPIVAPALDAGAAPDIAVVQAGGSIDIILDPAPPIIGTPANLDFGQQRVGTSSAIRTITVKNISAASVAMTGETLSPSYVGGWAAADWTISSDGCSATSISAGASCSFGIAFNPTAEHQRGALLTLGYAGDGNPATIELLGYGVNVPQPPAIQATPGPDSLSIALGYPADDGGLPVTSYSITLTPGGQMQSGPGQNYTFTGLSSATTYTITATAANAVGSSAASTASATPQPSPPGSPTNVQATAGVGSATVSWTAPGSDGGHPITGYTVISSGGATATFASTATSGVIAGLSATPHTFTVTASNVEGTGAPSAPSSTVSPLPGGTYHAVSPSRVLDTRDGTGAPRAKVGPGATINVQIAGRGTVPSTGVSSVVLNVTVANPTSGSYLSVFPTGSSVPVVSNLNFAPGETVPNLVEVALGSGGQVSIYNALGATDVVADVQGWVGNSTDSYTRDGLFNPLPPARILDTRDGTGGHLGKLGPGQILTLQVSANGGVPASGASAVAVNVTVTNPTSGSYLTLYPAGGQVPLASNLNFAPGETVPNRVMVGLSSQGQVSIYNAVGYVDVVVDVNGWFTDAGSTRGGAAFVGVVPTRIFDSRDGFGAVNGGEWICFTGSGTPPSALVLNTTVTDTTSGSYLTLYPGNGTSTCGPPPLASDLNWATGETVPNLVVVAVSADNRFAVYNSVGSTDVVLDEDGYYGPVVPAPPASAVVRVAGAETSTASPSSAQAPRYARPTREARR